jgi:hypothetical protein
MAKAKTTNKKTPAKAGKVGRKKNGQFEKGHSGNPNGGNRISEHRKKLREALEAAVTVEDIQRIIKGQLKKAEHNTEAAKFVFDYVLGKPAQQVNLGTENGNAVKLEVHLAKDS